MSGHRLDQLLASAAVAILLASPMSAHGEEAAPSQAGLIDQAKTGAAPAVSAGEAPTSTAAGVVQTAAPEEARAADPLAALDPVDRAIAERIRDLLAAKPNRIFIDEKAQAAVEAFYQKRNLAPLWLDKGAQNARSKAVIARLENADADGLEAVDYKTPAFDGLAPDALAEAELKFTQTVLTYARHVQAGRAPHRMVREDNIALPQRAPDPAQVLAAVAEAADAGQALDQYSPPHEPYQKLKAALAELRRHTAGGARDGIAAGRLLTLNRKRPVEDARVPQLRERLGVPGEATDLRYDEKLSEAVKAFQKENRLPATGNLDALTVKKLNPTNDGRVDTIIANMERWRWYHRAPRNSRVEVNEPDFTLRVIHDGRQIWTTRVVIGKPSLPSPLLAQQMDSITINPTWKVPQSIVRNEYLPAEAAQPGALARMGIRMKRVDGEVEMTMAPGGLNPLGNIRFNFFNRLTVFQHDTPDQYLFAHVVRAESHGCMRVQDAAKYAEVLASIVRPEEKWTADKVKSLYGGPEQEISLGSGPIWIYLTYQTAFVDDSGKLQTRRDLYNLDSRTLAAIKAARANPGSERKAEPVVASPAPAAPARRKVAQPADRVGTHPSLFGGWTRSAQQASPRGVVTRERFP